MPILYPASNRFKYARSASGFRERRRAIQTPPEDLLPQPVVLTKADGTVFVTTDGKALVRGFRYVTPQE